MMIPMDPKNLALSVDILKKHTVDDLIDAMIDLEQADCPVRHYFGDGFCIREVRMKAGTFAIGHIQNFPQMNVFIKGKVLMLNPDGTKRVLEAPATFMGPAGRKVGYILEDVIWQNIWPTTETDIEKIEAHFLTKKESFLEHEKIRLGSQEVARLDYQKVLSETGFSHELAVQESESSYASVPCPEVAVLTSTIEGKGLHATASFRAGDKIMGARIKGLRTQAGRFVNHSPTPNAEFRENGDDVDLYAIKPISGMRGGQRGDEITVDYRQALRFRRVA